MRLKPSIPIVRPSGDPSGYIRRCNRAYPRPDRKNGASHDSLASFLEYASAMGLSTSTSVYVGTLYEYTVLTALSRFGMSLTRSGGRGDRGVDLYGTWSLPSPSGLPAAIHHVIVSCKERTVVGPQYLRELDGVSRGPDKIGILASSGVCTLGMRQHLVASRRPLAYACVLPYTQGGYVKQFLWNGTAAGLLGPSLGTTTRYVPVQRTAAGEEGQGNADNEGNEEDSDGVRTEIALTIDGKLLSQVESRGSSTVQSDSDGSAENEAEHDQR